VRRLTTLDISYRQAWLIKDATFEQIHRNGNNLLEKRIVEMKNGNKGKKMRKRKEPND
jgi:molybdenum-dependent DNA-binding transcriptional regulator ModE